MTTQNIEDDYTENEVRDIFFLACEKGRLDYVKFFMHNKELKHNVDLKRHGYTGLKTALNNKNGDIVEYLFSYPEIKLSPYFNLTDLFLDSCRNNLVGTLNCLMQFAVEEKLKLPYTKGFSLACLSKSTDVLSIFISHDYICENIGNNFIIDQFDFAVRHSNPAVIKFFLTNDSLNFRINTKYYSTHVKGFNTYYKKIKVAEDSKQLLDNYEQTNELLMSLPTNEQANNVVKKKFKI